jgi:hypothetical protein
MCLQYVVISGLKAKLYDQYSQYRSLVLQSFGHSRLITLYQLSSSGLLVQSNGTRTSYSILCKRAGLTMDNVDKQDTQPQTFLTGPKGMKL